MQIALPLLGSHQLLCSADLTSAAPARWAVVLVSSSAPQLVHTDVRAHVQADARAQRHAHVCAHVGTHTHRHIYTHAHTHYTYTHGCEPEGRSVGLPAGCQLSHLAMIRSLPEAGEAAWLGGVPCGTLEKPFVFSAWLFPPPAARCYRNNSRSLLAVVTVVAEVPAGSEPWPSSVWGSPGEGGHAAGQGSRRALVLPYFSSS